MIELKKLELDQLCSLQPGCEGKCMECSLFARYQRYQADILGLDNETKTKRQMSNEENEHPFKPYQDVLVRDSKIDKWRLDCFKRCREVSRDVYDCVYGVWKYCIPYEGNESLLRTNKSENKEECIVRENKFRGYCNVLKKWVFGNLLHTEIGYFIINKYIRRVEAETEWHDLRKDPTDVPNNDRWVWVCFIFPNKNHYEQAFYSEGVWRTTFAVDCNPDAWCELPKFEDED